LYEDEAVTAFNCCAISDKECVPQAVAEDAYPVAVNVIQMHDNNSSFLRILIMTFRCGDLYEDEAVTTFNCCAVSDKQCVPQAVTEDAYPVPKDEVLDNSFDISNFEGRWYITAGYNKLFDTFDCQEHYFDSPDPGKLFAKIQWRINKPDGDFLERSTIQRFVQVPHLRPFCDQYIAPSPLQRRHVPFPAAIFVLSS
jgi:hypothetical protein